MADPAPRLLGVDASDAPLVLLGLREPQSHDRAIVEAALERRMRRVCDHPGGPTPEAAALAWILCLATEVVLDPRLHRQAVAERPWLNHVRAALVDLLGVRPPGDPFVVLDMRVQPADRKTIDTALFKCLNQVYEHAERRTAAGEFARAIIRASARALKNPEWQRLFLSALRPAVKSASQLLPSRPVVRLTPFDRQAMAILVGEGGWNRRSRGRLVALASGHGITVQGLVKIIAGLNDYARAGGPRLGLPEITAGSNGVGLGLPDAMAPRGSASEVNSLTKRLSEELRDLVQEDSAVSRIKLSMYFGIATIAVSIFVLQLVLSSSDTTSRGSRDGGQRQAVVTTPDDPAVITKDQPTSPGATTGAFVRYPTMLGNARPSEAISAADQIHISIGDLQDVLTRLAVTDDPAEPVYRRWESAIDSISRSWVMLDLTTREEATNLIGEVFMTAAQPTARERFWDGLSPIRPDRVAEPLDIWRGAWITGTLASLSRRHYLPPAVIERARSDLAFALPEVPLAEVADFDTAAWRWLMDASVDIAIATDRDPASVDRWELWIAAQRKVASAERWNEAMMAGIASLLRTGTDLGEAGPAANALGRLLSLADLTSSPIAKRRVIAAFNDADVTSNDLWAMTSLLDLLPELIWFDGTLVVPHDADSILRSRHRDRLDAAWPDTAIASDGSRGAGVGLTVNLEALAQWRGLVDRVTRDVEPFNVDDIAAQLVAASLLNEVAGMLAAQDLQRAMPALTAAERLLEGGESLVPTSPAGRVGQPIGPDGEWTARYQETAPNEEKKVDLLGELTMTAGSDLGPTDAETLVREAYRGNGSDVRAAARSVVVDRFPRGPNVALELLDQLPTGRISEAVIEMTRRVSGRSLPSWRAPGYEAAVRLALVQHVLSLMESLEAPIDVAGTRLIQSYAMRHAGSRREGYPSVAPRSPEDAVRLFVESLRDRASTMMMTQPVPDDLDGLRHRDTARMRLAVGPLQLFVAAQLAALDLSAYIAAAERPGIRSQVEAVLRESTSRRGSDDHVLLQAVEVERAMLAIWELRFMPGSGGNSR